MIGPALKPPHRYPKPKPKRLQGRKKAMTLIAAFRMRNNGILLCADRMENDGCYTRPIDKIHRLSGLKECEVFIAGAGTIATIKDAYIGIDHAFRKAEQEGRSLLTEHRTIIEECLKGTHQRYKEDLKQWPLGLLVVIAPRLTGSPPILYATDRHHLIPEATYFAYGSGKTISDYLADRLYVHGLENDLLVTLATFICKEAAQSSSGVGLGNDMVFIYPGGSQMKFLYTDLINEIAATIPSMKEAIYSFWRNQLKPPDWLKDCNQQ
jgi:20S proteasome alpha/beta subunit